MDRRSSLRLLAGLAALAGTGGVLAQWASSSLPKGKSLQDVQRGWKALLRKGADVATQTDRISRTDEQWKSTLAAPAYSVLRHEGTERPFSSPLNDEHRPGVFVCAGCALPLFSSEMKFDSGTGWPSFYTSIPGAFATSEDSKLIYTRTEYHCIKCEGHHGHLFDDGPKPTGQRWCNNGVALRFIPA